MEAIGYLLVPEVGLDFISNLAFGPYPMLYLLILTINVSYLLSLVKKMLSYQSRFRVFIGYCVISQR